MTRKRTSCQEIGGRYGASPAENEYLDGILERFAAVDELAGPIGTDADDLRVVDFDLRALVDEAMDVLSLRAQEAGLELAWRVLPDVPSHLRGDAGRLRRVLLNLSTHAIRFAEWYQLELRVSLDWAVGANNTIRFRITDASTETLPANVGGFLRSVTPCNGTAVAARTGTGLRLAASRHLSGLLGGRIGIESEDGRGSTFWFAAQFQRRV